MPEEKQAKLQFRRRRERTPTVLQTEAVECGAAALGMILGYYGRHETLEALRLAAGVSRDGSKASNIARAGRAYGLTVKGQKLEIEDLDQTPLPAIVFWNFNHFVTLEGFGRGVAYINDPATGPRTVSLDEFDEAFTGVVLTFEKGPEFKKGGQRSSLLPSLGKRLKGSELALSYAVIAGLALVVPGLVIPVFSKVFVDNVLIGRFNDWLPPLLLGMGATALLRGVLTWLQQHYLGRMETRIALREAGRFTWHMLSLPMEFFTQRFAGDIASRVKSNDVVAKMISGDLATTVINLLTIVFYLMIMWRYDVVLTLLGLGIALLNLGALRFFSRRRVDVTLRLSSEGSKLDGTTMGGLQMIETLKATGTETDYFAKWSGYLSKFKNAQMQLGASSNVMNAIPPLLTAVNTAAILTLGGLRVMQGELSMGMLVAFQSLMASFMEPVNQMVELGGGLQTVQGDMSSLDDVYNYPAARKQSGPDDDSVPGHAKLSGHLELRGVTFGYSRLDPPLIENFDLVVRPGYRAALVGGSGSGKSTVSKLVAGLYQPWSGEILFDGKPRGELSADLVNNSVAMVDQDIFIFGGTVRENLTMWDGTIPSATVVHAAQDACIHDDVATRHGGYDGLVEEGGRNWSGGQRQRLEIARALAIDPTILILDEATSALDPKTEKMIDDHLRTRGCSCLIVAHRLSTIRDCDEIIVMDRGKVVQRGTHEEMARDEQGTYYRLIAAE